MFKGAAHAKKWHCMQLHHVQLHARYCYLFNWCCKINVMARSAHLNNFQSAKTDMGFGEEEEEEAIFFYIIYYLFIWKQSFDFKHPHSIRDEKPVRSNVFDLSLFSLTLSTTRSKIIEPSQTHVWYNNPPPCQDYWGEITYDHIFLMEVQRPPFSAPWVSLWPLEIRSVV